MRYSKSRLRRNIQKPLLEPESGESKEKINNIDILKSELLKMEFPKVKGLGVAKHVNSNRVNSRPVYFSLDI